jgi:hypothetical protein
MKSTANNSKRDRQALLPPPRIVPRSKPLRGKALLAWLKEQGARPIPPKERTRLRKLGFLGMPDE